MRSCLNAPSSSSTNSYFTSSTSQDNTPTSSVQLSPTVNLTREYALAVQTSSYGEIRRIFYHDTSFSIGRVDAFQHPQLLEQVLRPNRQCVQEALSLTKHNSLTYLVETYFEQSEHSSRLCLLLYQSLHRARFIYTPINNLLDDLHVEFDSESYSLSLSHCELAFNVFLKFDCIENPFFPPDSHDFHDMRQSFFQLRQQLNRHRKKSQSRVNLIRLCSTGPICPAILPSNMTKREMIHLAQLDAAAKGVYVLYNDLDTIERLVARLHAAVENDRLLIHLGLERGVDKYSIQEILKQIKRNRSSFGQQLVDLEEHLFLCFAAINRARSLLLQEIHMHQSPV